MDGKALRKAIREDRFGDEDSEKVFKAPPGFVHHPDSLERFCHFVTSHLEEPNVRATLQLPPPGSDYATIQVESSYEKVAADFGEEDEIIEQTTVHSLINVKNGNVYLPTVDGNEPQLEYGARCNTNDSESYMHALTSKGMMVPFKGNARILIELGVDIDSQDSWGETALMHACAVLNLKTVKWLINKGANPNIVTTGSHTTALHRATEANGGSDETKSAIVSLLLTYKANPNAKNAWGVTPLHIASLLKLPETCRLLIEAGADRMAKDYQQRLPENFARMNQNESDTDQKNSTLIVSLLAQ